MQNVFFQGSCHWHRYAITFKSCTIIGFERVRLYPELLEEPDQQKGYISGYGITILDFKIFVGVPAIVGNFFRRVFFPHPTDKKGFRALFAKQEMSK